MKQRATRMCPIFARAYAETEPHRLAAYVESYGHAAAPNRPVDDPSRPFASDEVGDAVLRSCACNPQGREPR